MNTIKIYYESKSQSEQEDFLKEICGTHYDFICAVIRKMSGAKDILCKSASKRRDIK